jgi:hypothetical protein
VRQGDPFRPLLFAITLQGALQAAAETQLARLLAFADDTFLQGTPEPTMQAFVNPLGLYAQQAKSAVYSEDNAAAASAAGHLADGADGRAAGSAVSGPSPLASAQWQPPTAGGTSASGMQW